VIAHLTRLVALTGALGGCYTHWISHYRQAVNQHSDDLTEVIGVTELDHQNGGPKE
jgi:hypothetical protein